MSLPENIKDMVGKGNTRYACSASEGMEQGMLSLTENVGREEEKEEGCACWKARLLMTDVDGCDAALFASHLSPSQPSILFQLSLYLPDTRQDKTSLIHCVSNPSFQYQTEHMTVMTPPNVEPRPLSPEFSIDKPIRFNPSVALSRQARILLLRTMAG